jgi:threonine/homoserine/homoserine lactone efflux protein
MVNELAALVVFAFVGSVSPGPNNAVLWASGIAFGFRRTLPHVVGTALGIGVLVVAVAVGVGAFLEAVLAAKVALKVIGSAYLLYLAFLVAGSGAVGRTAVSRPLGWWQAIAFQLVNPKAWVFAVAAVGAFLPPDLPWPIGVGVLVGILGAVVVCSSAIWAAGGVALGRVVEDERRRRVVSIVLAVLIVVSIVFLWI